MRILIAGGSGVIGRVLIPVAVDAGHEVFATTRSPAKTAALRGSGATPLVADAFDAAALAVAVDTAEPDVIVHLLTDLAAGDPASSARLRAVGTRNLVAAARRSGVARMLAESISWVTVPGTEPATEDAPLDLQAPEPRATTIRGVQALEDAVRSLSAGTVLRFGQLYGPGTWYSRDDRLGDAARQGRLAATRTVTSFLHVEDAGRAVLQALDWPPGIWNVVDDEPAPGTAWAPVFAAAVGAPPPATADAADIGRPVSNAAARAHGMRLRYDSWRTGFATL